MTVAKLGFRDVEGFDQLLIGNCGKLNSIAFTLQGGSMCLYSPVAGMAKTDAPLPAGQHIVSLIFAANHYHNKGLKPYATLLPQVALVCSDMAKPRLQKQTGLNFAPLDMLQAVLPKNMKLLTPAGLKTGEVWLQVQQGSKVAWVVTDAFCGKSAPEGEVNTTPSMLGTFPKFGVKDARVFRDWVANQIAELPPTHLLPCHGPPVEHPDLGTKLIRLLADTL